MVINVQTNSVVMMLSLLKIQNFNKFKNHFTILRLNSRKRNNQIWAKTILNILRKKIIPQERIRKQNKK